MYCAFHPTSAAMAACAGCSRQLCVACDHRIKGQPFCEDCIVRGVDALRRASVPIPGSFYADQGFRAPGQNRPSPLKATILALIPGLGAVYNRQNLKALFHFVGTVGLIELADATNIGFFGFGGAVFFLYSMIDANRSAKAIAAGASPSDDERRLKWLFARYRPVWGFALIFAAVIAALGSLASIPLGLSPARLWALMLFASGAYMVYSYFRSLKAEEPRTFPSAPRSVVSTMLPEELASHTAPYEETRSTSHLGDR